jgi:hypothetical protein
MDQSSSVPLEEGCKQNQARKGKAKMPEEDWNTVPAMPRRQAEELESASSHPTRSNRLPPPGDRPPARSSAPWSSSSRPPAIPQPASFSESQRQSVLPEYSAEVPEFSSASPYVDSNNRAPRTPISTTVLHQVLQCMPVAPEILPPGKCIRQFHVNAKNLGVRSEELQKVGLILFTPGITPQLKKIEEWFATDMVPRLGVDSVQVWIMGQSTFLLVMDSEQSRQKILALTPIMMKSRMVLVQPFDPAFDISTLHYKSTAVWVDLEKVDPILEIEALKMLEQVGPVIHSPLMSARSRFENIRGCVLVDLTKDLVEGIEVFDDYGNKGLVKVKYKNLPLICHLCRVRGHLPRTCPLMQVDSPVQGEASPPKSTMVHNKASGSNAVPLGSRVGRASPHSSQLGPTTLQDANTYGIQSPVEPNLEDPLPPASPGIELEDEELIKNVFITSPVRSPHEHVPPGSNHKQEGSNEDSDSAPESQLCPPATDPDSASSSDKELGILQDLYANGPEYAGLPTFSAARQPLVTLSQD